MMITLEYLVFIYWLRHASLCRYGNINWSKLQNVFTILTHTHTQTAMFHLFLLFPDTFLLFECAAAAAAAEASFFLSEEPRLSRSLLGFDILFRISGTS